ncbi:MAG: undecaprenyldiphospho-muramoylpentapeptide beta-N-acetylglucosaminyltransferase [Clostridia bacterium]|nr:undecaprenyldiphospho-muramoylpentapeptide beta-N-acetylglucosaminyltransferase [Clostridia bacterium]
MKVLMAGGGTAGHINPAIAIAKHIRSKHPDAEIRFVGTHRGMEEDLVPKEGFRIDFIDIRGFKRKLTLYNVGSVKAVFTSQREAAELLDDFGPDVVIGTGGYVSWPVLHMAAKRGIPTAIHEQNAFPGLTTRLLSKEVDVVMISFDAVRPKLKKCRRIVLTGNPIREEIIFTSSARAKEELGMTDKPILLSFAGSLGARVMNENFISFITKTCADRKFYHIHATGTRGYLWVPDKLKEAGFSAEEYPDVQVREYIYNMPQLLAAADVVVCRAGAITLSEIAAQGKCAVLVPSPNVTNDHQNYNARAFSDIGAAKIINESDLSGDLLKREIYALLDAPEKRLEMGRRAQSLAVLDSNERIYETIKSILK